MSTLSDHRQLDLKLLLAACCLLACCGIARASDEFAAPLRFELSESFEKLELDPPEPREAKAIEAPHADPAVEPAAYCEPPGVRGMSRNFGTVRVGYDSGFVIASFREQDLNVEDLPFLIRLNGWGQLRHTNFNSDGPNANINQFQLKRGRLVFSGHAFTSDFMYFVQIDGRSSSGDDIRLLDYFLTYDLGHHELGLDKKAIQFKAGRYKMPYSMARYLSGREFEFTDRSVASTFFDINRSLGGGFYGERNDFGMPWNWEFAIYNGFVTGGAETGSAGTLDNNFAYSGRLFFYPVGEWGKGQLADLDCHTTPAVRAGLAFANTTIERDGLTEFASLRVVDSGARLETLLPGDVDRYNVSQYAVDVSTKWHGWSTTFEYYFRVINDFEDPVVPQLYDHGFWMQIGKFVVPGEIELLTRWSRVVGNSGTLGGLDESSDEVAAGAVWYFRDQHSKLTFDFTHLNGAPINSAALDIAPGDAGWLFRTQVQFAF